MEQVERIEVPVGDMVFRARAAGPADGRLVLLLHGFPQTSACWARQLPDLAAAGYRAVAPDQRGYSPGARPEGIESYGVEHLVADVLAVADWMGGHRFDVVGHDWGAVVAWHLAGHHTERVRSLTALSVPHPQGFLEAVLEPTSGQGARSSYIEVFRQPELPERLLLADGAAALRAIYPSAQDPVTAASVAEYLEVLTEPGALTAALNWYRAASPETAAALPSVSVPTLFVWSDNDPFLGRAAAETAARHVEGPYRFEVLEGVSHWIPEEGAQRLNPVLLEHLAATS